MSDTLGTDPLSDVISVLSPLCRAPASRPRSPQPRVPRPKRSP